MTLLHGDTTDVRMSQFDYLPDGYSRATTEWRRDQATGKLRKAFKSEFFQHQGQTLTTNHYRWDENAGHWHKISDYSIGYDELGREKIIKTGEEDGMGGPFIGKNRWRYFYDGMGTRTFIDEWDLGKNEWQLRWRTYSYSGSEDQYSFTIDRQWSDESKSYENVSQLRNYSIDSANIHWIKENLKWNANTEAWYPVSRTLHGAIADTVFSEYHTFVSGQWLPSTKNMNLNMSGEYKQFTFLWNVLENDWELEVA